MNPTKMSTQQNSNFLEFGYKKVIIELKGKQQSAAECKVCKIPLHNTGIISLKRHRNRCKFDGNESSTKDHSDTSENNDTSMDAIHEGCELSEIRISKSEKSKFDELGYTKTLITIDGKPVKAAECWKCKMPLRNTSRFSLERHRNRCKLGGGRSAGGRSATTDTLQGSQSTNIENNGKRCYICNSESDHFVPITAKSKHTETRISEFIQKFLNGNQSERQIENDFNYSCDDCFDKISEYDLACSIAAWVEEELCELLKKTESSMVEKTEANFVNAKNESESMEIKLEPIEDDEVEDNGTDFDGQSEQDLKWKDVEPGSDYESESKKQRIDEQLMEPRKKSMKATTIENEKTRSYECDVCPETLATKKSLKKHRAEHKKDEKPFRCSICNFDAKAETALAEHIELHRGLSPLQCVICQKTFSHKRNIMPHMRMHTGEKKYQCDRCGKEYFHKSSFNIHMYYHDAVKGVQCSHCARVYPVKSDLDKHMRIHTGEKPYACDICDKRFALRYRMREHRKIHDKSAIVKNHKCTFCDAAFVRKSKLMKHLEKHETIVPHSEIQNNLKSKLHF